MSRNGAANERDEERSALVLMYLRLHVPEIWHLSQSEPEDIGVDELPIAWLAFRDRLLGASDLR